ncbi:hypothetical protein E1301_Tti013641 [Triplophysa tibetana]|uniref:Uncharacterized protein n=1 Tax=Triplophysa tibetana TaxID=1572043 RepID=A0A5A9PP61_9TELE|nr:hypothetical protein E1301_Tti013641 [Triplophysa tibetana]
MCDIDEMSLAASEGDWHPTLTNPSSTPSGRVQDEAEVMSSVLTRGYVVPEAEPDDVVPSCSSCSETAYSKAKKRELHAWNAVKDDMLKVSFEGSAPITTQCVVCQEHGDYRLAYPLYVINELLRRCQNKNIHLRVVYDIACLVASHLHSSAFGGEIKSIAAKYSGSQLLQKEHLYDPVSHKGFIEMKLQNMRQHLKEVQRRYQRKRKVPCSVSPGALVTLSSANEDPSEWLSLIKRMKPSSENITTIRTAMEKTFNHRRNWISTQ